MSLWDGEWYPGLFSSHAMAEGSHSTSANATGEQKVLPELQFAASGGQEDPVLDLLLWLDGQPGAPEVGLSSATGWKATRH